MPHTSPSHSPRAPLQVPVAHQSSISPTGSAHAEPKLTAKPADDRGVLAFFREFWRSPAQLGTCFISSRSLARAMVRNLALHQASSIVELGPGPGPLTREIVAKAHPRATLIAIERNQAMVDALRQRFPNVHVHHNDAGNLRQCCADHGIAPGQLDFVVCSIPFMLLPGPAQEHILQGISDMLRPGGGFTALTYRIDTLLPSVRAFRKRMEQRFSLVRYDKLVLTNFPPAAVYRCER